MLKVVEKTWNEFWAAYWRIERRHAFPGIFEWDRRLVDFVEHTCRLSPGARILDLGCGGGDQAKVFSRKGYNIVGIDIAPSLIQFAQAQFKKEGLAGNFLAGDMRQIAYDAEFDACVLLSGTFGFFSDAENQALLVAIRRALKPAGMVFIMYLAPDQTSGRHRTWSETGDGWELTETWFDSDTASYRSTALIIRSDGTLIRPKPEPGYHADERIRCYTVPEMRTLVAAAGLRYEAGYTSRDLSLPLRPLAPDASRNIAVGSRPVAD